jgi:hypothetical protein
MDALKKHYGEKLQAGREEGRDLMADALCAQLGIPKERAQGVVQDLEAAGSIQWSGPGPEPGVPPSYAVQGTSGSNVTPIMVNTNTQGYWRF